MAGSGLVPKLTYELYGSVGHGENTATGYQPEFEVIASTTKSSKTK